MENKTKTAVELFEDIVKSMVKHGSDFGDDYPALLKHIENTKEVERTQLIKAVNRENIRCTQIANDILKIINPEAGELFSPDDKIGEIAYQQIYG
jgi:hypothetical protein